MAKMLIGPQGPPTGQARSLRLIATLKLELPGDADPRVPSSYLRLSREEVACTIRKSPRSDPSEQER